jgi:protein kinase D
VTPQQVPMTIRHIRSTSTGSSTSQRIKIPHTFVVHNYTRPTVCQYCKKLLRGFFKQGVQCRDCHYNAHKKCVEKVPKDCESSFQTDLNDSTGGNGRINNDRDSLYKDENEDSDFDEMAYNNTFANSKSDMDPPPIKINGASNLVPLNDNFDNISRQSEYVSNYHSWINMSGISLSFSCSSSSSPSANIPLMRIVQSVKHTKKRDGAALKEGWLVHFTNKDKTIKRHYWRLDSKAITLFVSDQGSKYYREVPLNEILAVDSARNLQSGNFPNYHPIHRDDLLLLSNRCSTLF